MTRRRFTAYVEALLHDRRPPSFRADAEDAEAIRAAIELRADQGEASMPSREFVHQLHDRLRRDLQPGHDPEERPAEPPRSLPRPVSRRWLLEGAGVAAAGAGVAIVVDRTVFAPGKTPSPSAQEQLVPEGGTWQAVGPRAALSGGAVTHFDTTSAVGFVTEDHGNLLAVSGICTHQGCLLQLNQTARRLDCPCHRTAFALSGNVLFSQLQRSPGPLPRLNVRDRGGEVEVYLPTRV
jgi:Rieske Fe-S protein